MAREEIAKLEPQLIRIEQDIRVLLLPRDPNDDKNIVLEIRAGTGGDEATLFADEVYRMYTRFAEVKGWKVDVTHVSYSSVGGVKEVIALISGVKVFSQLKYKAVRIAFSAFRRPRPRAACTLRRSRWRFFPKRMTSK